MTRDLLRPRLYPNFEPVYCIHIYLCIYIYTSYTVYIYIYMYMCYYNMDGLEKNSEASKS